MKFVCNNIGDVLSKRLNSVSPLPLILNRALCCIFTYTWIAWHSQESLNDAFKLVRSWLVDGWEGRLENKGKSAKRSLACL